jgi:hypothetical protein
MDKSDGTMSSESKCGFSVEVIMGREFEKGVNGLKEV